MHLVKVYAVVGRLASWGCMLSCPRLSLPPFVIFCLLILSPESCILISLGSASHRCADRVAAKRSRSSWWGEVMPGGEQEPGERADGECGGGGLYAHQGEGRRADGGGDRDPEREQGGPAAADPGGQPGGGFRAWRGFGACGGFWARRGFGACGGFRARR